MKKINKKGFTIVELVIVIAVIAILAAVLIPTFSNVISSANKTANLQEAQSTLKAYTSFMASNGRELGDGSVFEVKNDKGEVLADYVFYKGALHEFSQSQTLTSDQLKLQTVVSEPSSAPEVTIAGKSFACNKKFQLKENDVVLKNSSLQEINFYFYYGTDKNVTFEDGSKKCKIYAGTIVAGDITTTSLGVTIVVSGSLAGDATISPTTVNSGTMGKVLTITTDVEYTTVAVTMGGTTVTTDKYTSVNTTDPAEHTITFDPDFAITGAIVVTLS